MALENSPSQPDNPNSEIPLDDLLKLISDSDRSLEDLLKLILDAVSRAYRIRHLRPNPAYMEDIAQSIVLVLIRNGCRVLRSFEGRSSLETWLQPIADHEIIHFYRRQKEMMGLEDLSPGDQAYPPSQDDKVLYNEIARKLTEGERRLLDSISQELKTKEIAERCGIKPNSVSKAKRRLFRKIRGLLESKRKG